MTAGFVGLGQIGAPMARRVAAAMPLVVFDVAEQAIAALVKVGAQAAPTLASLAERCDVVCVMVNTDEQVRSVVAEMAPHLREGAVVVIHSTVGRSTAEELADQLSTRGVAVLDAPVSGGAMGAANGTLALLVGGDQSAMDRAEPVLSTFGAKIVRFGPVGAGTKAKLARNLLHFTSFAAVGEVMRLAESAGLSPAALGEVVRHSDSVTGGPGAIMLRDSAAVMSADDGLRPIFEHTARLGEKDVALALELADELGVELPVARAAQGKLRQALGLEE